MNKTEYLEYCNQMYAKGTPIVPDEVYDRLVENTELENQVGYIEVGEQRFKHPFPMYSLQKVFVGEDKEPDWDINETRIMTAKLTAQLCLLHTWMANYNRHLLVAMGKLD